jgi:hypothetical protein
MAKKSYVPSVKYMQYSKKMASRVTIFWMIYRLANFIVATIRPDIVKALVDLTAGVDTIMIVNMSAYTTNSATEKVAIAFGKRKSLYSIDEEDEEDEDKEEDNNG